MIHLVLPTIPPSLDAAYRPIIAKGHAMMVLTAEGRKYKTKTAAYLAKKYVLQLGALKPNKPYALYARYHMPVNNAGYPKNAKTRYKKLDATNRIKILEDVIADVTAVDDSHHMISIQHKVQGEPKTEVWIWSLEEEGCPFYEASLTL